MLNPRSYFSVSEQKTCAIKLSVKNLGCHRDDRELFAGINADIAEGDVVQVAGSNGSGKTTLLRILCGLMSDYTGDIEWCGQRVNQCWEQYRAQLIYIGHAAGINPTLTAKENLAWLLDIHGQQEVINSEIESALAKVGLCGYEDVQTHQLSAGQKRRVGLARLYLERSPCWILDEPFTAIDRQGVAELEQLVCEHAGGGGMVILTTHHQLQLNSAKIRKIQLG